MSEFKFKGVPNVVDAKIIKERPRERSSGGGRNHGGPGNQADRPALAKVIADATQTNIDKTTTTMNENIPKQPGTKKSDEHALAVSILENEGKLNKDALDLLQSIDEGGVPAMMTARLRKIAEDNGLDVKKTDTPNFIIERLRNIHSNKMETEAEKENTTNTMAEKILEMKPTGDAQGNPSTKDNSWQSGAVAEFESKGGRILDAKLEKQPIPILTEVVENEENISALNESRPEFAVTPEAKLNLNQEQEALVARLKKEIAKNEEFLAARAEKAKVPQNTLRAIGEKWNKFPLRYKFLISAGMITAGVTLGAAATPAIAGLGIIMRGVGGLGMFDTVDKKLKSDAEKRSGKERTKGEEFYHTVLAAGLSLVVASLLPGVVRDYALHPLTETIGKLHDPISGAPLFHNEAPVPPSHIQPAALVVPPAPSLEYVAIAHPGDTRWGMIGAALTDGPFKDQFSTLNVEQKTYVIDALKDKLEEGVSAEDAGVLNVGDKIDFHGTFDNKDFMSNAFAHANGLTIDQQANIHNFPNTPITDAEFNKYEVPATIKGSDVLSEVAKITQPNIPIESLELKGTFQYSADGTINGYQPSSEGPAVSQQTGAQKLLNGNWHDISTGKTAGVTEFNTKIIEGRALSTYQLQHDLDALEHGGRATSPEANYLKAKVESIVTDTERTYGDVFKNLSDFSNPVEATPTPSTHGALLDSVSSEHTMTPHGASLEGALSQVEINQANTYVHDKVQDLFGTKIFGFTIEDGMENANWRAFAGMNANDVMNAGPHPTEAGNFFKEARGFGMGNNQSISKMQNLIFEEAKRTTLTPTKGETIEQFLYRTALDKAPVK